MAIEILKKHRESCVSYIYLLKLPNFFLKLLAFAKVYISHTKGVR